MIQNDKMEECIGCVIPTQCRKCGKLFDLDKDFKQHLDVSFKEVLEEECGASELLCWHCRVCD